MAPANAAKKYTRPASRTASTPASTAPRRQKASNDADACEWRAADQEQAAQQGWGVFTCIDEKTLKVFMEMQAHGPRFGSDNAARDFIMQQNKAGDELAIKAMRVVFRSKAGTQARSK